MISKQHPCHEEISGTSTKPTQTQLYWHQIPETIRWYQNNTPAMKRYQVQEQNQLWLKWKTIYSKSWRNSFQSTLHIFAGESFHLTQLFFIFEFESTRLGESLIDLVCQYPALWDKQNAKYKDSNYKDAKWREIAEILGVPKDDVIKKWKSLWDTYVRHKNIKAKSGDGLSDSRPRWKYYTIMSFLDVTLLKRRYAPILLEFTYIHSYKLFP